MTLLLGETFPEEATMMTGEFCVVLLKSSIRLWLCVCKFPGQRFNPLGPEWRVDAVASFCVQVQTKKSGLYPDAIAQVHRVVNVYRDCALWSGGWAKSSHLEERSSVASAKASLPISCVILSHHFTSLSSCPPLSWGKHSLPCLSYWPQSDNGCVHIGSNHWQGRDASRVTR